VLNFILYDYPVVGSTNDEAKALLQKGAGEGTVVRATRQTAGRGRRGRRWISEPGNLYFSLILAPKCLLSHASQLSFVMAVAVGEAILSFLKSPEILSYKWPNDLLLDKKKVAGILIETDSEAGQLAERCVVGIGLNLTSIPDHPAYPVTALNDHAKSTLIPDVLFTELLEKIKNYYGVWNQEGFEPIREKWLRRAHSLGQDVTITVGDQKLSGCFKGLSQEGALLLEEENGDFHMLMSAEVS
jgi:BirA family biotin operon repressor/biotin-[acetyl-CoA-carboxylase] ligase